MSLSGKVFLLVFVCVAAVMFVGMLAYVEGHNKAVEVTISNTSSAYYDLQSDANQSINQTMKYGGALATANSPFPLLIALFVMFTGIMVFLVAVKRR